MKNKSVKAQSKSKKILFLLPSLIGFLIFFIIPFLYSFYYAFVDSAFSKRFVGLANFSALLKNEYFILAMKNTLLFTVLSVPLIMLLSIVIALMLLRFARNMPFVRNAFFLPVLLPSAAIITVWNAYLTDVSDAMPFLSLLIIFLWKYSGLNIMLILTALTGVNRDMLEAARIDGASPIQQTLFFTLPNIMPTLFFTLILSVVNSMKIFRESYLLWGSHPDENVYMLQNFLNNHFEKLNYQNISTAAILFALLVYAVVAILFRAERKWSESVW